MKKLLQLLYPGLGGHSSVAFSLIEGDSNIEFSHTLLGFGIEQPSQSFIKKANELKTDFDSVLKVKGLDVKSQYRVFKILKKQKPDIILMHSTSLVFIVWIYCLLYKKKWAAIEHQANQAKGIKDWVYTFFILHLAPHIVYLTPQYKKEIREKFHFIPNKKIKIISNGINLEKFRKYTSKDKINNEQEIITISMISRMNYLRDHKTLIEAFKILYDKYTNIELYIAGDGEQRQKYIDYANILNLKNIYFLGSLNENQIIDLLNKSDIYVHSSLAETLSTSLLQVAACKVPIVATDIEGINNLLENKTEALLFQPKNKYQLVDTINAIIDNTELRGKLVDNAYNKVKVLYNNKNMFKQYKQIFYS